MNFQNLIDYFLGLAFILVFALLIILFAFLGRKSPARLREIPAFYRLRRLVGLAVEAGTRLHLSIGRGSVIGPESAAALAGLTVLDRVARAASMSDRPPVVSSGEGNLAILSRDTLQSTYRSVSADAQFDPTAGRLAGLTPFSYAAGTLPLIHDEHVSANILAGHFGSEVALLAEAGERSNSPLIGGTDDLSAQAILYAAAQEPLIGEELYAGGAYLGAGPLHAASLRAQDVFRWLLIAAIIFGAIAKLLGVL